MLRFVMGAAAALFLLAGPANAAFFPADPQPAITGPGGNFCGSDFDACSFGGSPAILKVEFADSGAPTLDQVNTNFPSVGNLVVDFVPGDDRKSGTWTYTAGPSDPGVTAVFYKFGNGGEMYVNKAAAFIGQSLIDVPFDLDKGLSNIVLFDSTVVPLPAAAWMLGAGLVGLGYLRRRKQSA